MDHFEKELPVYKFEKLKVWDLSLELGDRVYRIIDRLPEMERFNLRDQMIRAVTSISLNIAEGSTSSTDKEQVRYLSISIRSLLETIACIKIILRRDYLDNESPEILSFNEIARSLFIKLSAFKKTLLRNKND